MESSAAPKETIIIVHGTWAAPDGKRWYEVPTHNAGAPNFVSKLNAALEQRGSPAKCWAHCTNTSPMFSWSGENTWVERARAASNLADYLAKLGSCGWRCHVVAHSHGGNVAMEVVRSELTGANRKNIHLGEIVFLGTPFIDTMSRISALLEIGERRLFVAAWLLFCLYFGFLAYIALFGTPDILLAYFALFGSTKVEIAAVAFLFLFTVIMPVSIVVLVTMLFVYGRIRPPPDDVLRNAASDDSHHARILILGSAKDEAWQALNHVSKLANPLAIREGIVAYVWKSWRDSLESRLYIDRLGGFVSFSNSTVIAKIFACLSIVFYSAVALLLILNQLVPQEDHVTSSTSPDGLARLRDGLILYAFYGMFIGISGFVLFLPFQRNQLLSAIILPTRYVLLFIGTIFATLPKALTSYFVVQHGWPILQRMALGLEGYNFWMFETPDVRQTPAFLRETLFKYENMPANAEQRALQRRARSVHRQLNLVTGKFSNAALSSTDVTSLLKAIEADVSLVHAAYYTDDECIERIADWIAGTATTAVKMATARLQ